jgi:uncharacterized protein YbjT (DUF2867 family)
MTDTKTQATLVLGGTGKTGRRVAQRLSALGRPVRVGSRSGRPSFDWEDRATWAPALDGAGAAYVSYYPDLAAPGAVEATDAFARLAVGSGVSRQVLLAGRGEPEAELAGEVALPAGDTPEPFVDADDIADVAVAALTQDGHAGQLYELTGPRLLTFAEAVGEIAKATGRQVRYLPVSLDEYVAAAAGQGVPAELLELFTYLFSEVLDGRNARVADGVRRALGREPRDFAVYACDAGASGVWDVPAANGADQ